MSKFTSHISEQERERIRQAFRDGSTPSDVMRIFTVSRMTAYRIRAEAFAEPAYSGAAPHRLPAVDSGRSYNLAPSRRSA